MDDLDIDTSLKEGFKQQPARGKLISLILEIRSNLMLSDVETILEYKIKCK